MNRVMPFVLLQQNPLFAMLEHDFFGFFGFFNHGTIFIKQALFHALRDESFLDCDISLIKTCQLFSSLIEEEPKLYSLPPALISREPSDFEKSHVCHPCTAFISGRPKDKYGSTSI